jgi:hypothetical protein
VHQVRKSAPIYGGAAAAVPGYTAGCRRLAVEQYSCTGIARAFSLLLFKRAFHWYSKISTIVILSRDSTRELQVCSAHGAPHFCPSPTTDVAFAFSLTIAHHIAQFYLTLERAFAQKSRIFVEEPL